MFLSRSTEECEEDEKQCSDGTCITVDYLCDGIVDCSTGEDEEGCSGKHQAPFLPSILKITSFITVLSLS